MDMHALYKLIRPFKGRKANDSCYKEFNTGGHHNGNSNSTRILFTFSGKDMSNDVEFLFVQSKVTVVVTRMEITENVHCTM